MNHFLPVDARRFEIGRVALLPLDLLKIERLLPFPVEFSVEFSSNLDWFVKIEPSPKKIAKVWVILLTILVWL